MAQFHAKSPEQFVSGFSFFDKKSSICLANSGEKLNRITLIGYIAIWFAALLSVLRLIFWPTYENGGGIIGVAISALVALYLYLRWKKDVEFNRWMFIPLLTTLFATSYCVFSDW